MLDRRAFVRAAVVAAVVFTGPVIAGVTEPHYRRFDSRGDRWVTVRKRDVRRGDTVWIEGDGVYAVSGDAAQDAMTGRWTFGVYARIDPANNQWELL